MKKALTIICLLGIFLATGSCATVFDLSTELYETPLGLDMAQPRFSWKMKPEVGKVGQKQTAYRILVASEVKKLREGRADIWDSKKIESHWSATGGDVKWTIVVPPNSTLYVSFPGKNIRGIDVQGITFVFERNGKS